MASLGLRHMSESIMKTLSRLGYVPSFNFSHMSICEHYFYDKKTMSPHNRGSLGKAKPL